MQFENLYQELAGGVEMIRALVVGMTGEQARSRPQSISHVIGCSE